MPEWEGAEIYPLTKLQIASAASITVVALEHHRLSMTAPETPKEPTVHAMPSLRISLLTLLVILSSTFAAITVAAPAATNGLIDERVVVDFNAVTEVPGEQFPGDGQAPMPDGATRPTTNSGDQDALASPGPRPSHAPTYVSVRNRVMFTPAEQVWVARDQALRTELRALNKKQREIDRFLVPSPADRREQQTLGEDTDKIRVDLRKHIGALGNALAEGAKQGSAADPTMAQPLTTMQWTLAQLSERDGRPVALITTFITAKRLHLILTTPDRQVARFSQVGAIELASLVQRYRVALQDPRADALILAQTLYGHLVGPISADLDAAGSHTLLWSLDGVLSHIPMAALHDGKRWLIERQGGTVLTGSAR